MDSSQKISQLPVASALTGAETIVIVQTSDTKRSTIGDLAGLVASSATAGAAAAAASASAASSSASAASASASAASSSASAASSSAATATTKAGEAVVSASAAASSAASSASSAATVDDLRNAGGNENLFPDPFFIDTTLTDGFNSNPADSPYNFVGTWGAITTDSVSPYFDGNVLVRPNSNTTTELWNFLEPYGIAPGDTIQIAHELRLVAGGPATIAGTYAVLSWLDLLGNVIGSTVQIVVPSVGTPLTTTYNVFNSGDLIVPAGAFRFKISYVWQGYGPMYIASLQIGKPSVGGKPVQRLTLPDAINRVESLEAANPANPANNVVMRRTTYASIADAPLNGTWTAIFATAFTNNSGAGGSYLTAAWPTGGANGLANQWTWTASATTGVARIIAVVRTCTGTDNPLIKGRLVAWGWIDTDPASGGAGSSPIQFFDPVTGAAKTVMPADLDARVGIGYITCNLQGGVSPATQAFVQLGTGFTNIDSSNSGIQFPSVGGYTSPFANIGGANFYYPKLVLMTSPVTATKTPSDSFSALVAASVYESPDLIAAPKNVYCVVGREASLYYYNLQQRSSDTTNFKSTWSAAVPAGSGAQEERVKYVPTSAGTNTLTLNAFRGEILSSTAVCNFISVAASSAAGTKVIHYIGDSLVANGARIAALKVIEASQAVTTLTFIGSTGAIGAKNDGYSGAALGDFRGANLPGPISNPFYDPGTLDFDYAYWKANTGLAFPSPDFVFIEAGGVDVGTPTTDAAAQTAANNWAVNATFILNSIKAAFPSCKVVFTTKEIGPQPGEEPAPVYGPTWRVERNWRILAATNIATFGTPAMAAAGVYTSPTSSSIDPVMGWSTTFTPRSSAITRDMVTYATYAAMQADLAVATDTLAFCTDVAAYFVKVGGSGLGRWRDAQERDGFIRRHVDTIHWGILAASQIADAEWAVIKHFG